MPDSDAGCQLVFFVSCTKELVEEVVADQVIADKRSQINFGKSNHFLPPESIASIARADFLPFLFHKRITQTNQRFAIPNFTNRLSSQIAHDQFLEKILRTWRDVPIPQNR